MRVPMLDLSAQRAEVTERALQGIGRLAASGRFILGPAVEAFEGAAARYLGVTHAVGLSSGSDAVVCALLALGIGAGDEVITTPFSFFATVEAILRVGALPRFVDIRPDTYELDVPQVAVAFGPRTRAVLSASLFGEPGRLEELRAVGERYGVPLVEDAAQVFGARRHGRAAGTFGAAGCFSFMPAKPLGAWGDAGMLVTDDAALAERCRKLRVHGSAAKHQHALVGGNYRMDAIQALVLSEKLPELDGWLAARRAHHEAYDAALGRWSPELTPPTVLPGSQSSASVYTVRVANGRRDALAEFLRANGVEVAVHYPVPFHRQPALTELGLGAEPGSFPEAERAAREVLSLPIYPELSVEQREYVVATIRRFFSEL